jgi:hypothetical protein
MNAPSNETTSGSLTRAWLYAARYYLGSRRAILLLATIAIVAGIALNWSWLVATGIAPILLTALPCLIMCGLGLCMNRLLGGSCESSASQQREAEPRSDASITQLRRTSINDRTSACCHESSEARPLTSADQNQASEERRDPHA